MNRVGAVPCGQGSKAGAAYCAGAGTVRVAEAVDGRRQEYGRVIVGDSSTAGFAEIRRRDAVA